MRPGAVWDGGDVCESLWSRLLRLSVTSCKAATILARWCMRPFFLRPPTMAVVQTFTMFIPVLISAVSSRMWLIIMAQKLCLDLAVAGLVVLEGS